jgi:hypothetical protein
MWTIILMIFTLGIQTVIETALTKVGALRVDLFVVTAKQPWIGLKTRESPR